MGAHKRRLTLAVITATSLALAACGGSSSSNTTSSSTASASSASSPAGASTTAAANTTGTLPPAFTAALNQIEGPYRRMAASVEAELQAARSQSDAAIAAKMTALAATATALSAQLGHVTVPTAVQAQFAQLHNGTNALVGDLKRMAAAATAHNAAAARAAANDLNQAFTQVANGISGLKQKGVK